jgi:hypothetical protein
MELMSVYCPYKKKEGERIRSDKGKERVERREAKRQNKERKERRREVNK